MALDILLKKYFSGVVLALIAMAAYFQAAGATQLVGSALTLEEGLPPPPALKPARSDQNRGHQSADPILTRNAFDSVTGPIDPDPPVITPEVESGPAPITDPLAAPRCDGTQVMIVTESDDPTWSVAAVQGPGEPHPTMRRVGDPVGDKKVAYIGFNPREASPAVWFEGSSAICQVLLFGEEPQAQAPQPQKPSEPSEPKKRRSRRRGASPLPKEMRDKIKRVSDTEFHIDRSVVDKILEDQAELMKSARIVPEKKDGKVVGIRMFGVRPDTLLGTLGFQNGDRLETINGFNMASPEKALQAYARLRTANNLNVKISRRGKPMSIDFRIK